MRPKQVWNDDSRDELRDTLRTMILGELPLAKRGREEVLECLRDEGFEPDWNRELSRKIGVSLNWQRRTTIE